MRFKCQIKPIQRPRPMGHHHHIAVEESLRINGEVEELLPTGFQGEECFLDPHICVRTAEDWDIRSHNVTHLEARFNYPQVIYP